MTNYNPFSLDGKTILVTGASSGIGRTTAIECSRLGAHLVITGRHAENLTQTYNLLDGKGHVQIVADLSCPADIERLVALSPVIDGFVNNAGQGDFRLIDYLKQDIINDVYQVNVFAPMKLVKQLLRKNKILSGGSIVFTSSFSALLSAPALSVYASSKAAITAYMRSCAVELGPRKIRANAVLPGTVETPFISNTISEDDVAKDKELYALKRYGKPEDVAYGIIYMLSDAAAWITGTSLVIDGGRLLK